MATVIRNGVLATTISNALIRDADCIQLLYEYMEKDKLGDIVILMTSQHTRRDEDKKIKDDLYAAMPEWLRKHVWWPIGDERFYDRMFIVRVLEASNTTIFTDTNLEMVKNVSKAMKARRSFDYAIQVASKTRLKQLLKVFGASWRVEPDQSALMEVC